MEAAAATEESVIDYVVNWHQHLQPAVWRKTTAADVSHCVLVCCQCVESKQQVTGSPDVIGMFKHHDSTDSERNADDLPPPAREGGIDEQRESDECGRLLGQIGNAKDHTGQDASCQWRPIICSNVQQHCEEQIACENGFRQQHGGIAQL